MNITDIRKQAGALACSLALGILITLLIACEPPTPTPMQRAANVRISTDALSLTEGGEAGSYTVALNTRPSGNVEITIAKTGPDSDALTVDTNTEMAGDQNTLTFTPERLRRKDRYSIPR